MGCANLAQQYNFGITEFEKHYSPISDFNKILKPRDFGYASCIYHSRRDLQRDVLFKAGREMLKKNLQESWLGGGQYIEALIWLRLVYQYDESSLSPLQILLKAYENMPDVPRPSFLSGI
jgi:hypothetical protein